MLAKGSTIEIESGSELIFDNRVILWEDAPWADRQVYMELNKGATLTFGELARLEKNTHQIDGKMKLNIYMNGGQLNIEHLNAEERN